MRVAGAILRKGRSFEITLSLLSFAVLMRRSNYNINVCIHSLFRFIVDFSYKILFIIGGYIDMTSEEVLSPLPRKNLSEVIVNEFQRQIISGKLSPGDKIPTEVELSSMYGVSRNVVREAVKILEFSGVLEIRRADGTYVVEEYSPKLLNPIVYGIILSKKNMEDLVEFYNSMLHSVLSMAKTRITEEELQNLDQIYQELKTCLLSDSEDIDRMFQLSTRFYTYCGELAQNKILFHVFNIVLDVLSTARYKGLKNATLMDKRRFHMNNYTLIMSYLKGTNRESLDAISIKILEAWKVVCL